jgi:hypothetical protein
MASMLRSPAPSTNDKTTMAKPTWQDPTIPESELKMPVIVFPFEKKIYRGIWH